MISNDDIDTLARATAYGPDGEKLGKVGEVYLDNDTGKPAWVTVVTGLFGTRRHFAPLDEAVLDRTGVRLPYDKDTITGAPNIDEDGELTPLEEDELYRYYHGATGLDAGGIEAGGIEARGIGTEGIDAGGTNTPDTNAPTGVVTPTQTPVAPEPTAQGGTLPPDVAQESIAGDYRPPAMGQRDEALARSVPGRTAAAPSASSSSSAQSDTTARHAADTPGAGDSDIIGPGPTGPAHPPEPEPVAETPAEEGDSTASSESGTGRRPRLVKRVVTTGYYEEDPDAPGNS